MRHDAVCSNLRFSYEGGREILHGVDLQFNQGSFTAVSYTHLAVMLEEFDSFMTEFAEKNAGKESPKVLVLMGLPGSYIIATDNSYVGSLVKLAGGTNVYGDGDGQEFLFANTEDMKTKEPDVILRAAHGLPDEARKMFAEEFSTNDIWQHFKAVQEGRVYDLSLIHIFGTGALFQPGTKLCDPFLFGSVHQRETIQQ